MTCGLPRSGFLRVQLQSSQGSSTISAPRIVSCRNGVCSTNTLLQSINHEPAYVKREVGRPHVAQLIGFLVFGNATLAAG